MTRRSLWQKLSVWFPPIWVVGLLCLYLIVVSLVFSVLGFLLGISDENLEVFALPVAEELLKLLIVLKLSKRAFGAIVTFGVLELLLVKAPILYESYGVDDLLSLATASLIAFGFHVATALAYRSSIGGTSTYSVFGTCVVLHILFNSISFFDLSDGVWSAGAIIICAMVVASSWLIALASRQTNET